MENEYKNKCDYTVFGHTDISRQLLEAKVPHSAYLYVESLWSRNRDLESRIKEVIQSASNLIEEMRMHAEKSYCLNNKHQLI